MREIKFRAWHTIDTVMVYDLNSPSLEHGVLCGGDYILMQYTGLKDKNGKEIYEGDILYDDEFDDYYFVDQKMHESCGCCSSVFGWSVEGNYNENSIVGNIYENPELLQKIDDACSLRLQEDR